MGNTSPLRRAIRDNDTETMKEILKEAEDGSPDIINEDFTSDCLLSRTRNIQSPLHTCVAHRKIEMAEELIKYGADVNMGGRDGMTPLHYAAKNGDIQMCKMLVKYGASTTAEDNQGQLPLHSAAASVFAEGRKTDEVLNYLFGGVSEKPQDINACDVQGRTPLHIAAFWGYIFIVKWLLNKGADKEIKTKQNRTALDEAKRNQKRDVAELLLSIK